MEPEEEIYVNLEDLDLSKPQRPQRPEDTGAKPMKTDSLAERETRTCSWFKVATLCLGLLSFLLLLSVMAVSVLYQRDFSQLSRDLANQTGERNQVLMMYQNLTNERDRLGVSLKMAEHHLDQMRTDSGEDSFI
ncbi:hypothetical protein CHARACLAT_012651 [Characodon lateralis]|uniref:Uncharacterized protein n=1 Tax=Characodon lateralis TaxID=208331 RepID=A0ABU7E970_9TELE|nr:hypothetical protein [Characodon lateralis]